MVIGAYLGLGKSEWRLGDAMPGGLKRLVISPLVGFLSVLMGIGGGSFGVPLMSLYNIPIHRAVATAAGFGVTIAVPSVIGFMLTAVPGAPPFSVGAVNLPAFVVIITMTMITAALWVMLRHVIGPKTRERRLTRFIFSFAANPSRSAFCRWLAHYLYDSCKYTLI